MSWCSRSAEPRGRPALLEVSGLTKSFGPLTVLLQVSLSSTPLTAAPPFGRDVGVLRLQPGVPGPAGTARRRGARSAVGRPPPRAGTALHGGSSAHGGTLVGAATPSASWSRSRQIRHQHPPAGGHLAVVEEPEEQRGG